MSEASATRMFSYITPRKCAEKSNGTTGPASEATVGRCHVDGPVLRCVVPPPASTVNFISTKVAKCRPTTISDNDLLCVNAEIT